MVEERGRQIARFKALLHYLLGLRTPEAHPLICAELFLQQIIEDCEGRYGWSGNTCTPAELFAYAYGRQDVSFSSSDMTVFFGTMELHYRQLVCGIGKPDWLCGRSGPQLLHPDFPVYLTDRETKKDYIFAIKPMEG